MICTQQVVPEPGLTDLQNLQSCMWGLGTHTYDVTFLAAMNLRLSAPSCPFPILLLSQETQTWTLHSVQFTVHQISWVRSHSPSSITLPVSPAQLYLVRSNLLSLCFFHWQSGCVCTCEYRVPSQSRLASAPLLKESLCVPLTKPWASSLCARPPQNAQSLSCSGLITAYQYLQQLYIEFLSGTVFNDGAPMDVMLALCVYP